MSHEIVGFADQLHITILNTVVNHFYEVTGTCVADPITTGLPVFGLGSDSLQNGLNMRPGFFVSPGHDGRAVARSLFSPGNTGSNKADPFGRQLFVPAIAIFVVGVSAVDDDVSRLQNIHNRLDGKVHGFTGLHHQHDNSWLLESQHHVFDVMVSLHRSSLGFVFKKFINFVAATIAHRDLEAVIVHVEDQVLTHHGKAIKADICFI